MLELKHKKESYQTQDGKDKEYNKFYVEINGIEVQLTLSAGDKTGYQVLLKYFDVDKK